MLVSSRTKEPYMRTTKPWRTTERSSGVQPIQNQPGMKACSFIKLETDLGRRDWN